MITNTDRALLAAAKNNDYPSVSIMAGATLNAIDNSMRHNGWNALHWAAWHGNEEMLRAILSVPACRGSANQKTSGSYFRGLFGGDGKDTALHIVSHQSNYSLEQRIKIAKLLLESGVNPSMLDSKNRTALSPKLQEFSNKSIIERAESIERDHDASRKQRTEMIRDVLALYMTIGVGVLAYSRSARSDEDFKISIGCTIMFGFASFIALILRFGNKKFTHDEFTGLGCISSGAVGALLGSTVALRYASAGGVLAGVAGGGVGGAIGCVGGAILGTAHSYFFGKSADVVESCIESIIGRDPNGFMHHMLLSIPAILISYFALYFMCQCECTSHTSYHPAEQQSGWLSFIFNFFSSLPEIVYTRTTCDWNFPSVCNRLPFKNCP